MLGFLTRSIAHRDSQPNLPDEESEGEQEEEDGVQIPGMPPAPKSITLSDPYPGGQLAGRNPVANAAPSKTPPDSADVGGPLEHDGSTTIIFVKAGSEHRALLYLMQKVGLRHDLGVRSGWLNRKGLCASDARRMQCAQDPPS